MKLQRCSVMENLRDIWRVGFYVALIICAYFISLHYPVSDVSTGIVIGASRGRVGALAGDMDIVCFHGWM